MSIQLEDGRIECEEMLLVALDKADERVECRDDVVLDDERAKDDVELKPGGDPPNHDLGLADHVVNLAGPRTHVGAVVHVLVQARHA